MGDANATNGNAPTQVNGEASTPTTWVVTQEIEAAHGVFEVNHVCWALRADKAKLHANEEVIVSTGDDGEVKVWTLDAP